MLVLTRRLGETLMIGDTGVAPLPWTVLDLGAKRLWATSSSRS